MFTDCAVAANILADGAQSLPISLAEAVLDCKKNGISWEVRYYDDSTYYKDLFMFSECRIF